MAPPQFRPISFARFTRDFFLRGVFPPWGAFHNDVFSPTCALFSPTCALFSPTGALFSPTGAL